MWVENRPSKTKNQIGVITFLKEDFVHTFNLFELVMTNCRTTFVGKVVLEFAKEYKVKLMHSTLYFIQANGQVEASNKIL